ncbi:hypothetical protein J6P52_02215 [bacterium]|nr:hypothetical protein [bacterium]
MNNTNYNIEEESNNTLYRLEIINRKNPSEYFYSNSLSPNDSLVFDNISFANNTYNIEQENSATYGAFISNTIDNNVDLVLSLSQFGKNTTNNELLKELSVSYDLTNWYNEQENTFNEQSYLNNTSNSLGLLSSFYNGKNNEIIIPIPFSLFVDYEQQSIANYNYNFGTNYTTQYKPIRFSLTILQDNYLITTNSLVVSPEIANIALTSTKQFSQVNNTYYCKYGQNVTLNSNNSNIYFPSTTTYQ